MKFGATERPIMLTVESRWTRSIPVLVLAAVLAAVALSALPSWDAGFGSGPFTAGMTITGKVTTEPVGIYMGRDFFSWTGRFDVFDMATDRVAYTVTGKLISIRKRVVISDAATGVPVAIVQKCLSCLQKVYEIYRWKESFPGQLATEKDDSDKQAPLCARSMLQPSPSLSLSLSALSSGHGRARFSMSALMSTLTGASASPTPTSPIPLPLPPTRHQRPTGLRVQEVADQPSSSHARSDRYGWVQKQLWAVMPKYLYAIDQGSKDPSPILEAYERFQMSPFAPQTIDVVAYGESAGEKPILASIGKPRNYLSHKLASWLVDISAPSGMDEEGMLALAIGINNIMEEVEEENNH